MSATVNPAQMPPRRPPKPARPIARRDKPVPSQPEDIAHAADAEALRQELAYAGFRPTTLYPTLNRQGYVVLTFDEVRALLRFNYGE